MTATTRWWRVYRACRASRRETGEDLAEDLAPRVRRLPGQTRVLAKGVAPLRALEPSTRPRYGAARQTCHVRPWVLARSASSAGYRPVVMCDWGLIVWSWAARGGRVWSVSTGLAELSTLQCWRVIGVEMLGDLLDR